MICYPNAKINLGLSIVGKRSDGYHSIESIFFPIPWTDILEVSFFENEKEMKFVSSGLPIPGDESINLCVKAYEVLRKQFNIPPLLIHLHKQIPMGAGLGGGSADGAFVLKAINELCKLNLSVKDLERFASELGSDCAFFIKNKPSLVTGRGEKIKELGIRLKGWKLILLNPNIHVGTKEAYNGIVPKQIEFSLENLTSLHISEWEGKVFNQFEESVFPNHPQIQLIKEELYNQGASYASMTGSGSTVYGLFKNEVPELPHWKEFIQWKCEL